ncbi:dTDP-4-dehydrorhamnose reductase [Halothiobacillus diazotrophicus]|uniref:dTDP-4-dehydrorhamnose reductase n=1 Tax=Halothiobacillus diazotrophicus TaxID=1860122 RepID=A0A191ZFF9_9GAMM|nr:dTDP-4-dehydrorhamnose reductase [Halothiobacillus diazotrophicus]ANJ66595.1 dTDP-4-dehydrorhamnose reductase [Halothiobacillus diazotrophicus]
MKILLLGKNGQVGWELQRSLAPVGELIALDSRSTDYCGDLANLSGLLEMVDRIRPDVIVNAAAYTAVDKAESEVDQARLVNATAPGVLAEAAKRHDALLVHYSTDYVFDGSGSAPRQETDPVAPPNMYGQTKLEGEQLIAAQAGKHLIFRTSWVYAARGNNFAKTMLRLAKERDSLNIINDQHGAPTGAELIADVTAHAIRRTVMNPELSGLYHLVATGETTWFDYARFVIEHARAAGMPIKVNTDDIAPVPTSAFPTPAKRPLNSRLSTIRLQNTFDLVLPPWERGVERMLTEIL